MKTFMPFLILSLFIIKLNAQTIRVTGQVKNIENNTPISFCNVQYFEGNRGTSTDENGVFTINANPGSKLQISRIGFSPQAATVNNTADTLCIYLIPAAYNLEAVVISGKRDAPVGLTAISAKKVEQVTGISKDIMRTVQLTPGVSNNNEANAKFNVRGGTFDENLVLINGCRTYMPYHLKTISASSSLSVFNLNITDQIDFMAGGFSAKYGDALSAVMDIKYRKGNAEKASGLAEISLMDANVMLEGPVGKRITYLTAFKQSNFRFLAGLLDMPFLKKFTFFDWQGVVDFELNKKNTFTFTYITAMDRLKPNLFQENYQGNVWFLIKGIKEQALGESQKDERGKTKSVTNIYSLNWMHKVHRFTLTNIASAYLEHEKANIKSEYYLYYNFLNHSEWVNEKNGTTSSNIDYTLESYSWKSEATYTVSNNFSLNGGVEALYQKFKQFDASFEEKVRMENVTYFPDTVISVIPPKFLNNDTLIYNLGDIKSSAFLRANIMPLRNLFIDAGVRVDYYSFNENLNLSPRFAFRYKLPFGVSLKGAVGLFTQTPFLPSMSYLNIDTIRPNNQKAIHYITGVEKNFRTNVLLKVEAYYKDYIEILPSSLNSHGKLFYSGFKPIDGYSKGVDLFFSVRSKGFEFSLNYGLMEAKESNTDSTYCPRYSDQRHTLSSIISFDLGKRLELVLKGFYGSGYAYTPAIPVFNEEFGMESWSSGARHSAHYPAYSRVDLSLYKTFKIKDKYDLKVYLEIINLFNHENILSYKYTYNEDATPKKEADYLYPLMPSLGLSLKF